MVLRLLTLLLLAALCRPEAGLAQFSSGTVNVRQGAAGSSAWLFKLDQTGTNNDVDVANAFLLDATFTGRLPAAFASADNIAAQTATAIHGLLFAWDAGGGNWDRLTIVSGRLLVDGSGVTQPISAASLPLPTGAATETTLGTRVADATLTGRFPAGSTPADNESNTVTITRIGAYLFCFDGTTWDRCPGNSVDGLLVNLGANNDVTIQANASVNVNQVAGSAVSTAATGVQKVGVAGNAGAAFDAANNAAPPANVIVGGFETATQTSTQPTAATAGNVRRGLARTDGALYVAPHGPVIWSCGLNAIGTTLTQCQAAPGASLRLYITDVLAQSNTATAGLFTLRFGTGTNCGTGTGNLFFNSASALIAASANTAPPNDFLRTVPIAVPANNAVCVLGVATNTTNIQINGYTAP